jgi:hypothetical protein
LLSPHLIFETRPTARDELGCFAVGLARLD